MAEKLPPYGDTPDTSFASQYKRVFEAAECRTQAQLADVLEVRQSSVSDARRRKLVPSAWLLKLFAKKRVNPDWIRTGTGAKYLKPANVTDSRPHVIKVIEVRPPAECSAQDLINELVRRALQPLEMDGAEAAATWTPMKKRGRQAVSGLECSCLRSGRKRVRVLRGKP